ncbi:MAG: hypothetical protein JWQ23_4106 [Herminiimonas sp.]|nr:hypothetical protein [Herminiimonas sp.]
MNDDDIPVKTADGIAEIKTRARRLASRVRTVLLLVDGIKSIAELKKLMPASGGAEQALAMLYDNCLIQFPHRADEPLSSALPEGASIIEFPSTAPTAPTASAAAAAPAQLPAKAALVEAPVSLPSSTRQHPASVQPVSALPAWQPVVPADGPVVPEHRALKQLTVLVARAHLANALDEHLGFDGYLLRQDVVDCTSREQLESLFSKIEDSLIVPLGSVAAASVIKQARSIFDTPRPRLRPPPS